jgi:hypothetical protein
MLLIYGKRSSAIHDGGYTHHVECTASSTCPDRSADASDAESVGCDADKDGEDNLRTSGLDQLVGHKKCHDS